MKTASTQPLGGATKGHVSMDKIRARTTGPRSPKFHMIAADPRMGVVGLKPEHEAPNG